MRLVYGFLLWCVAVLPAVAQPEWGLWNTGEFQKKDGQDSGYHPDWQYQKIRNGSHLSPTFELISDSLPKGIRDARPWYFEPMWSHARENRLPLVFIGRNFEDMFRRLEPWASLTEDHPFIEYEDGTVYRRWLSPWNQHADHWRQLGRRLGQYLSDEFGQDYPNPPSVYLGNNNELGLPRFSEAVKDVAFPEYLRGAEKQLVIREMWHGIALRRGKFLQGLKEGCPEWADVLHVYAYSDFGNEFSAVEIRSDPFRYRHPWSGPGGDVEFSGQNVTANVGYLHSWSSHRPGTVRSPQVEACNSRYALERYRASVNPAFDLETHFWNGRDVPPDVWRGVVRCVLWTMRTDRNRLFLGAGETVADTYESDLRPLEESCEEVHENATLRRFWTEGTLLCNRWSRDWKSRPAASRYDTQSGYGHPYHWPAVLPPEEQDPGDRWYLQHVPLNQRFVPWSSVGGPDDRMFDRWQQDRAHRATVKVFSIALELDGEYLVFAHAPHGDMQGVEIQVCPDGSEPRLVVTVDVPVTGSFWHCSGGTVREVVLERPAVDVVE